MKPSFRSAQEIISIYQLNIDNNASQILRLKKAKSVLSLIRLIIVVIGFAGIYHFWPAYVPVLLFAVLAAVLFAWCVLKDADKTSSIRTCEALIKINTHELQAVKYDLSSYDGGLIFADPTHPYASDLDLFGHSSLFQWLNRCHAEQSKRLLANHLKAPGSAERIKEIQAAATELSGKQWFCQQLQTAAMASPLTDKTEQKLDQCMNTPVTVYQQIFWKWFQNIYTLFTFSILVFYISGKISDSLFLGFLTGFYLVSVLINRKASPLLEILLDVEPEVNGIYKICSVIESESMHAELLVKLQNRMKVQDNGTASSALRGFLSLLKRNDSKANILINVVLQIFFLWDLRLVISLNKWKKENGKYLKEWTGTIAEMEVLNSQASLIFNEPSWVFPEVDKNYFHFSANEIAHPLIPPELRVSSDFSLQGTGKIALITGSNMAGKSTFLRSLGTNTILALMGSPVCAKEMRLSEVKLISSMRVSDNLAENTSTFYAELKKLQMIIESVNRKEPVFILLDEVLRGTNSNDRHKGSEALVRQFKKSSAVAVMATHDTELAHRESVSDAVSNYHFEGKVIGSELYFDYKIKYGISDSLNATALMKKIGIEFED